MIGLTRWLRLRQLRRLSAKLTVPTGGHEAAVLS
jgi:hypothetical protein